MSRFDLIEHKMNCLGVEVNYIDVGKGQAMILLHNGGGFWQTWVKQIEEFRANYRVIALDWPSFGGSEKTGEDLRLEYYHDILEEFIQKMKLTEFILIGNCIGATVAIKYTLANSDKVSKLGILNVCPGDRLVKKKFPKYLLRQLEYKQVPRKVLRPILSLLFTKSPIKKRFPKILFSDKFSEKDELFQLYVDKLKEKSHTKSRIDLLFSANSFSLDRYYHNKLKVPTILFWGKENKVSELESDGRFFEEKLDLKLHIVENAGHISMYENPEFVNKKLEQFLRDDS